jgi:tRNA modification GTPase
VALARIEEQAVTLKQSSQSHRFSREGLKVALLGLPNAGKSSLFNCLIASERAIVTHIAGTTRDLISETLWIDGVGLTLMDTAGIHHSDHEVEQLGIERSWQAAKEADCLLFLVDATRFDASGTLPQAESNLIKTLMDAFYQQNASFHQKPLLKLATKTDCLSSGMAPENRAILPDDFLPISVQNNTGIMDLFEWLKNQTVQNHVGDDRLLAISLNHRQQGCLDAAIENLAEAKATLGQPHCPIDLTTVPLTTCMKKLDELLGRDTTEEMLTEVFKQFCVGK